VSGIKYSIRTNYKYTCITSGLNAVHAIEISVRRRRKNIKSRRTFNKKILRFIYRNSAH